MKPRATNGLFITIEGGEGAGKTTLIDGLIRELTLEGASVVSTREPGGTHLGEEIRKLLLHSKPSQPVTPKAELMLFLAARAQHFEELITPALQEGNIVICDRFHDSSVAYQGIARGMGQEAVRLLSLYVTEGIEPDLTLYLDIDPILGLNRGRRTNGKESSRKNKDRIESETLEFHRKVRHAFLQIAQASPERCKIVDATQSPEVVLKTALSHIHAFADVVENEK